MFANKGGAKLSEASLLGSAEG